jgi:hypothetical protein
METRETAVRIADHWAKILTQDLPIMSAII